MKFIDLFSGIGGFRLGMEMAGHKCVGHCEIDKFADMSYRSMHTITDEQREQLLMMPMRQRQKEILKEEYLYGEWYADDIRNARAANIPKADCWCFGFPCQDISIAGKTVGFNGNRSSLFFTVVKLVQDLEEKDRPDYLFIENVKNLFSVNRGFDFAKLLIALDEIGYDAEWNLFNSKDFGVPQNRERVFIIGHLRGRGGRKVFPIRKCNEQITELQGQQSGTVTTRTGGAASVGTYIASKRIPQEVNQIGNIVDDTNIGFKNPQRGRVYSVEGISPALNCCHGPKILTPKRTDYGKHIRKQYELGEIKESRNNMTSLVKRDDDISNTLTTVTKDNLLAVPVLTPDGIINDCRIRKLTPKECFRLQGWADEYFYKAQQFNSDSQLYKQAGNGVTVNVINAIAKELTNE